MSTDEHIEQVILDHRTLLLRFRDSCYDLKEVDPDEDSDLFGQILDYRQNLQDKIEDLFKQLKDLKSDIGAERFSELTMNNDLILNEIVELDELNTERLIQYKQQVASELKQTAINKKAISSYHTTVINSKRDINNF